MGSFLDFFKSIGSGLGQAGQKIGSGFGQAGQKIGSGFAKAGKYIDKDIKKDYGSWANFIEGMAGGVTDKLTGVTPEERFRMDMDTRKAQEDFQNQQEQIDIQRQGQESLEKFREASIVDNQETMEFRRQQAQNADAFRELTAARSQDAALDARNAQSQRDEEQREFQMMRDAEAVKNRIADREDTQAYNAAESEKEREFRQAQASTPVFKPTVKYSDFTTGLGGRPVPAEEAQKRYREAAEAEFKEWQHRYSNEGGGTGDPEVDLLAARDENVANAQADAEEPGAYQSEIDEAESEKNAAIAEFEELRKSGTLDRFNGGGSSLQTHGSGGPFGTDSDGKGAGGPALIEQSFSEADKQVKAREKVTEFRGIVDRVAKGDADAARQLGEIMSPEQIRGFTQLAEEYGPEMVQQLRQIYEQELHSAPPF